MSLNKPPVDKSNWCLNCKNSRFKKKITCDLSKPCSNCIKKDLNCIYKGDEPEIKQEINSIWSNFDKNLVQHYSEPLYLKQGSITSLNLVGKKDKYGDYIGFEWEDNLLQREDLRIKPHPRYEPTLVYPPTIIPEEIDSNDSHLIGADTKILNLFSSLTPSISIHPTILLNAVYSDRDLITKTKEIGIGDYPDSGNCLSIVNTIAGSSKVFWKSGDKDSRACSVTSGSFNTSRVGGGGGRNSVPSRKGKEREIVVEDSLTTAEDDEESVSTSQPRYPPFEPSSTSLISYKSPILQIQSTSLPSSSSNDSASSYLCATRSFTDFTLLHLSTSTTKINHKFNYPFRELSNYPISDFILGGIKFNDFGNQGFNRLGSGMMIDLVGNLYGWGLDRNISSNGNNNGNNKKGGLSSKGSKPEMFKLRKGNRDCSSGDGSGFARVIFGGSRGVDAVVGFRDTVLLYDLRTAKASTTLLDTELLSRSIPTGRSQSPSILTSLLSSSPSTPFLSTSQVGGIGGTITPTSIHVVCTSRDIIWLDDRMPNRDLLRFEHGRAGNNGGGEDCSLEIMELNSSLDQSDNENSIERLILHSKLHPHLSIYTYSTNVTKSPKILLDKYSIPSPTPGYNNHFIRSGLAVVPTLPKITIDSEKSKNERKNKKKKQEGDWLIMESGTDGAVYSRFITLDNNDDEVEKSIGDEKGGNLRILNEDRKIWSPEIIALMKDTTEIEEVEIVDGGRNRPEEELKKVDLKFVRKEIFEVGEDEEENRTSGQGKSEVLLGLAVEAMKSIEEDEMTGDRGILTGFDLVALASEQLPSTSTDDMEMDVENENPLSLDISPLPRPSTFVNHPNASKLLLPLDRLNRSLEVATSLLTNSSQWSSKLLDTKAQGVETLRTKLLPDLPTSFYQMTKKSSELLERYTPILIPEEGELKSIDRITNESCDSLILDLTLSSQVYSSRPITINPLPPSIEFINKPHPSKEVPPSLHFTFFQPTPFNHNHQNVNDDEEEEVEIEEDDIGGRKKPSLKSLGVRALLSEWQIGTNPHSYSWTNPYLGEKKSLDKIFVGKKNKKRTREELESSPPPPTAPSSSWASTQGTFNNIPPVFNNLRTPLRRISTIREESENYSPMETASQPVFPIGFDSSSQSQSQGAIFGASQILPGAFGGRNVEKEKKAKAKKRVSGF